MKILVVGGGAREHTLVWKLAQSPKVKEIYVAPGNAGTAQIAHNLDINATDIEALVKMARKTGLTLPLSGPRRRWLRALLTSFWSEACLSLARPRQPPR